MDPFLHSLWLTDYLERLGWTLLHFLWQGALVAALLGMELVVLRRASAQLRYLAAVVAFLMPLLTFVVLPLPARRAQPPVPTSERAPMPPVTVTRAFARAVPPLPPRTEQPRLSPRPPGSPKQRSTRSWLDRLRAFFAEVRAMLPWCVAAWTVGVSILSVRLLVGWRATQQLCRRGARLPDARWQASLERVARQLGIRRVVRLLESALAEVPAVIGTLRPVILLPVGLLTGLSAAQVEMILAHELAHVRRQDYLINLGLTLLETLGFYHPAVWWIVARAREEREHACDDLAVQATGGDGVEYARALATLEEMRGPVAGFALAATSGGSLLKRVRRMLGIAPPPVPDTGRVAGWLAGALALALVVVLTLGAPRHPAGAQEIPAKRALVGEHLRGRVVDEEGRPVPGALVYDEAPSDTMEPGLKEPARTGADGSFQVPKVRRGSHWRVIGARLGDAALGWLEIGEDRAPAVVGADNVLTKPIVLRARRYRLSGVCVDERGQPVTDARIAVTGLPIEGGGDFTLTPERPEVTVTQFFDALTARSDAQGRFSLTVPVNEGLFVEINASGRQTVEPFAKVKAGAPEVGDLWRITLKGAGVIAGRVAFAAGVGGGRSLKGMNLVAIEAGELRTASILGPPEHTNEIESDEAGNYRIEHLPPGTYTVYLSGIERQAATDTPTTVIAAENVAVRAGETTPLDLRAVVGRALPVQAIDADTKRPVAGRLGVHVAGPSQPRSAGLGQSTALTELGEWSFYLAPGHYRVFLTGPMAKGNPELASAEVDVPADRAPDPLLIPVSAGWHLQDAADKPIPLVGLATVQLLETSPRTGHAQGGSQSSDGTFDIEPAQAGIHARLAVDVPNYQPYLSPEFVVTDPAAPMTVNLVEAPVFTLRGRVLDQDGHAVPHAALLGKVFPAEELSYQVALGSGIPDNGLYTDQDGWFETQRMHGGVKIQVEAFADNQEVSASHRTEFGPTAQGRANLDMYAVPATRPPAAAVPVGPRDLVGHVVDARGHPVEGAKITVDAYPSAGAATTNAAGAFRFPDFGDRHYLYLAVAKEGYATHWETDLTVGRDFTMRLDDATHLRGQFLQPDGSPAGPAAIVLRTSRPTKRPFLVSPISNLRVDRRTDAQGNYDFPVEAGSYDVEVTADDGALVAAHENVTITAGQTTALPAGLDAGLVLRIKTVDRVTGQPAAGVKFYIAEETDAAAVGIRPGSEKQTDDEGVVQWDHLFPGPLDLYTSKNTVYQRVWSADDRVTFPRKFADKIPVGNEAIIGQSILQMTPGRDQEPIVMQVERGVKISGRVVDARGQPVGQAEVRAINDPTDPNAARGSDLVSFWVFAGENDGRFSAFLPAGNGLPARLDVYGQSDDRGTGLSAPFDSAPGDEREVNVTLPDPGWIEGSVVDAAGQPVPGIGVTAHALGVRESSIFAPYMKTDAQGRFWFRALRPAEYEIRTTTFPQLSVGEEPPQEHRRVRVQPGAHTEVDALHYILAGWTGAALTPPAAPPRADTVEQPVGLRDLAGHVLDAQGHGLAGATVDVVGAYPEVPPFTTDATGAFRFPDFGDRHYVCLEVTRGGYGTHWDGDLTVGRDLTVRMDNSTRLRGRLYKPDQNPAGATTIVLFKNVPTRRANMGISNVPMERHTDANGAYDFAVEPGTYRVEITANDENLVARRDQFTVPAHRATAFPFGLQAGLTLRIRTVDSATGQPAPGVRFYVREQKNAFTIGPRAGTEKQTDSDGYARWDRLFPGQMFLDLDGDPLHARFWSTDAREASHERAPKDPHPTGSHAVDPTLCIDVQPGNADEPVVVQTERGVQVSGRVRDPSGQPLANVVVRSLITDPADTYHPAGTYYGLNGFQARTAADGTFHGCAPAANGGLMRLVADLADPKPDNTLGNGISEPLSSRPGDAHEADIQLTNGGWIEGSVVDPQGKPLAKISVTAAVVDGLDGYTNHTGFYTDAEGHFRLGPLRPAPYDVTTRDATFVWGEELPEEKRRIDVRPGATVAAGPLHFDPKGWMPPPAATPAAEMLSARVRIVDESGLPIAGATVTPDGLHPVGDSGGHYLWPSQQLGPPKPPVTDAAGIAVVSYPRFVEPGLRTGAISFRAEHPDYCSVRPTQYRVGVPGDPEPVTLRRGAALRVSGHLPGSTENVPVYPQQDDPTHQDLFPRDWQDAGDHVLATRHLPVGRNYVRLAHAAPDGTLFFSETKLLSAVAGQTYTLDLELRPGVRVDGRLDASVPRLVRGGRVVIRAYATSPETDADWVDWNSWCDVAADGTFVFASLPPGRLEVTALCDGFTSISLPDAHPQHFDLQGRSVPVEIKMQPAATFTAQVRDAAGLPIVGARVALAPNVHWTPALVTIFCLPGFKMEEWVASPQKPPVMKDWADLNPFSVLTNVQGNATVRNLPPEPDVPFSVDHDGYEPFPSRNPSHDARARREPSDRVNLAPGATLMTGVRLEKPSPLPASAVTAAARGGP